MPLVHIDLSCSQDTPNLERGIPRYARDLSIGLSRLSSEIDYRFVLNSHEPVNAYLDPLFSSGKIVFSQDQRTKQGADLLVNLSPFYRSGLPKYEISKNYSTYAYLVHDLIPFVFPNDYLSSSIVHARHVASREFLRHADLVLTNSECTQQDVEEMLELPHEIVVNIGTGTSPFFRPAEDKEYVFSQLQRSFPQLRKGFVIYTGGSDWRKNLDRLIHGYAQLPEGVKHKHQLVLCFRLDDWTKTRLEKLFEEYNISQHVVLTDFVSDKELRMFYQTADLMVFPSLYEGYGMPVSEAVACGLPSIVADTSSLKEIVTDSRGRFDPYSIDSITESLESVLEDTKLGKEIWSSAYRNLISWDDVASRADTAIKKLLTVKARKN